MSYLRSYKRLNQLIQDESFEPLISWGMRMAMSGTLPVVWGLAAGRYSDAEWITITAEAVSWIDLKGSFRWRVRTLVTGAILSILFAFLGTITAPGIWLGVISMFAVGFLATLLKNIGDRASGLAICVFLLFIICNAYPVNSYEALQHRMLLVVIGAVWPVLVGIGFSLATPAEEPFRRQIAIIWRSIADLVDTISKSDNRVGYTRLLANVYTKEKEVRKAIDSSYEFYGRMAHQANQKNAQEYQLILLRKVASLVALNVTAMGEEMEQIAVHKIDKALRVKAATLFSALQEAISRISFFVISLKPEEKLLAVSHINRLRKLIALISDYPLPHDEQEAKAINRILQLTERTIKLLENALQRIDQMGNDKPVYRSYSMVKTLFVLKPQYLLNNLRVLFNFSSFNTRYAVRSAIAATVGLFISKWFKVDHGYWIPFSLMIIIQPYFGATFKKAIDRIIGTLLGGIAGGLLLRIPTNLHIKEIILFLTFVLMVYYTRKRYALATFAITLNLVLLFNFESSYSNSLMFSRAICTVGGAILAVVSGFALLPTWDRKWLPSHLAGAIKCNYEYFTASFFAAAGINTWTNYKRGAETRNSNVFESFNRYIEEPGREKSEIYYDLIGYNVRITRNLNNIHAEQDEKKATQGGTATPLQQQRLNECLSCFNKVIHSLPDLSAGNNLTTVKPGQHITPMMLNEAQMISLEKLIIELKTMEQDMEKLLG